MIKSNYDATVYLNCLREDFRALKDGDWVPDAASCDASMAVLQEVMDWLDRPKAEQSAGNDKEEN